MKYEEAKALFKDTNLNEVVKRRIYELDDNFNTVHERMNDIDREFNARMNDIYDMFNSRINALEGNIMNRFAKP